MQAPEKPKGLVRRWGPREGARRLPSRATSGLREGATRRWAAEGSPVRGLNFPQGPREGAAGFLVSWRREATGEAGGLKATAGRTPVTQPRTLPNVKEGARAGPTREEARPEPALGASAEGPGGRPEGGLLRTRGGDSVPVAGSWWCVAKPSTAF